MIIDMISDLHGYYPKLDGGDLLIVAGDLTARDEEDQYYDFYSWLDDQDYTKKIFIAGNHDNRLQTYGSDFFAEREDEVEYLCDSGTEFQGLKIWGCPWTKTFEGMNPHCKAFTCDIEWELAIKFSLIPKDTDILITHGPPHGILDLCENGNVGSTSLRRAMNHLKPQLWVLGHVHECYGEFIDCTLSGMRYHFVNASHVDEHYKPINKPIRVTL